MQQPWQADALTERQRVNESEAMEWFLQKRKTKGRADEVDRGVKRGGGVLEENGRRSRKVEEGNEAEAESRGLSRSTDSRDGDASGDSQMKEASPTPSSELEGVAEISGPLKTEDTIRQEWEESLQKVSSSSKDSTDNSASEAAVTAKATTTASAMDESNQQQQTQLLSGVKTSDTHPISISPLIPPELLIDTTRYVRLGLPNDVVMEGSMEKITNSDLNTVTHCAQQIAGRRLIRCHTTRVDLCEVGQIAEREMVEAAQGKRKPRRLMFVENRNNESPYLQTICSQPSDDVARSSEEGGTLGDDVVPVAFGGRFRGFTIGNMLLSSCPGKKVRLTGPVRGRGAICRNLGLDLKRIRQLGVGALICCLDDEELGFLGAPWSDYEKEADQLGMEVIRLPMAEGFCPTDVSMADNIITNVVEQYTLRGVNVLVHCRGGVGRAGIIACTWMLKMGLVRSDLDESTFQRIVASGEKSTGGKVDDHCCSSYDSNAATTTTADRHNEALDQNPSDDVYIVDDEESRRETMQIIRRLIDTIRRRRSPKAIETAEQVAFLFKYITFLRQQETKRGRNIP
jgi:protein-tyrosine phosphatase